MTPRPSRRAVAGSTSRAYRQHCGPEARLTGPALLAVLLGSALAPIDLFVVNVALPSIRSDLHASPEALGWVVTSYGLALAVLLVLGGRLGDAHGRRRLFVLGLAGFTMSSLACGLAPGATLLVSARALQGASAGLLVPQALSIIQAATRGHRRSRALGYYGATGGVSVVIGQLAGGVLVSADIAGTGWRPVFLINVPLGVVAIVMTLRTVPETRAPQAPRPDVVGTVLLGITVALVLVPLLEGPPLAWPAWSWSLLALAPLAAIAFAVVETCLERDAGSPLLPPSMLRLATMRTGLGIAVLFFLVLGGFLFVYALFLQDDLGLTPLRSGLALTPLGGGFLVLALLADGLVSRFGNRVVVVGGGLTAAGMALLGWTVALSWPTVTVVELAPSGVVLGIGLGAVAPTLFRIVLSGVPTETVGAGSGVLTTAQQVASALGVATVGTLFSVLRAPGGVGPCRALIITVGLEGALAVVLAVLGRRLPDAQD